MRLKGKFRCVGMSDPGKIREHNEDTIGTDGDIGLVVLADGMGGYKAGEVASGITVRTVMSLMKDAVEREDLTLHDSESGLNRPGILLRDAIQRANKLIYQTAQDPGELRRHGHDRRRRHLLRRQADRRPRRRFADVSLSRRQARAGHPGPLAAAGTGRRGASTRPRRPSVPQPRTT